MFVSNKPTIINDSYAIIVSAYDTASGQNNI